MECFENKRVLVKIDKWRGRLSHHTIPAGKPSGNVNGTGDFRQKRVRVVIACHEVKPESIENEGIDKAESSSTGQQRRRSAGMLISSRGITVACDCKEK
jgi:hypothetical protein